MHSLVHLTRPSGRLLAALLGALALTTLLIGVPWGLQTYLGWPLPNHLPTQNEIEAVLLNPLSVVVLLDILGCIAWSAWLIFVIDVVRCAPDVVRGLRPPSAGPIQSVAVFLLVAIVVGVLGPRGTSPRAATLTIREQAAQVSQQHVTVAPRVELLASAINGADHGDSSDHDAVVVRAPRNGVHDSLWRIARRELGDGTRWRELFETNRGRVQSDGQRLTDPNLIRPGWVLLVPSNDPTTAPESTRPEPSKRPAQPVPPADTPTPAPEKSPEQPVRRTDSGPTGTGGTTLVTGAFLSAVLASAVTGAVLARRRRRLRDYRIREDQEHSSSLAPVVHALRIADDQHQLDLHTTGEEPETPTTASTSPPAAPSKTKVDIGIDDGHAYAIDLAASHGLGVTGAGAEAAVRALLVHLLAATAATVVIPEHDVTALLGTDFPESSRLRITADLDNALAELSFALEPARRDDDPSAVLVATITNTNPRLQSLLDNGAENGVAGILMGHWPAGGTVRVRADGTITAASPTLNPALQGARLFRADATDTRDLITLFSDTPVPRAPDAAHGTPVEPPSDGGPVGDVTSTDLDTVSEVDERATSQDREDTLIAVEQDSIHQQLATSTDDETPDQDIASEPERNFAPQRSLTLGVFGQLTLHENTSEGPRDLTSLLSPKHKALLVLLALYPDGTTREVVREAMWPDSRQRRPFNVFYATISQIRKILATTANEHATDLIDQHGEHVSLNPELVEVDYWRHQQAERDRRDASTEEQRLAASSSTVETYRGELAEGMTFLWLDGPRESAHRNTVDALASMAAHYRGVDPERQLQLLEHARLLNPENEDIYRDIMRVQAELGRTDAISRTLDLLTTALAEIGAKPEPDTHILARALRDRQRNRVSASETSG